MGSSEGLSRDTAIDNLQAALLFQEILAITSLVCSAFALYIMVRMQVYRNRLMFIVFGMNLLQFTYDLALLPYCGYIERDRAEVKCRAIQIGCVVFSTLAVGTCTVLIACLVAYVIAKRKRAQISFRVIVFVVIVPSIAYGAVLGHYYYVDELEDRAVVDSNSADFTFYAMNQGHDYLRLAQVLINLLAVSVIIYTLKKMSRNGQYNLCTCRRSREAALAAKAGVDMRKSQGAHHRGTAAGGATDQYPMFVLARRLIWYPVIGSLGAMASFQYHFWFYGQAIDEYPTTVVNNPRWWWQTLQMFLYAIIMPMNGPLYAGVFFYVHTGAWAECKVTLWWMKEWLRYYGRIPEDVKKAIVEASLLVEVEEGAGGDGGNRRKSLVLRKSLKRVEARKKILSINSMKALETGRSGSGSGGVIAPIGDGMETSDNDTEDDTLDLYGSDDSLGWDDGDIDNGDYEYGEGEGGLEMGGVGDYEYSDDDDDYADEAGTGASAGADAKGKAVSLGARGNASPVGEGVGEGPSVGPSVAVRAKSLLRVKSVRIAGDGKRPKSQRSGSGIPNINPASPGDNPLHSF